MYAKMTSLVIMTLKWYPEAKTTAAVQIHVPVLPAQRLSVLLLSAEQMPAAWIFAVPMPVPALHVQLP
jgi:hypothetical protein